MFLNWSRVLLYLFINWAFDWTHLIRVDAWFSNWADDESLPWEFRRQLWNEAALIWLRR